MNFFFPSPFSSINCHWPESAIGNNVHSARERVARMSNYKSTATIVIKNTDIEGSRSRKSTVAKVAVDLRLNTYIKLGYLCEFL